MTTILVIPPFIVLSFIPVIKQLFQPFLYGFLKLGVVLEPFYLQIFKSIMPEGGPGPAFLLVLICTFSIWTLIFTISWMPVLYYFDTRKICSLDPE